MSYDQTNPESIETYGKRLLGGSLATVQGIHPIPQEELNLPVSGRTRGSLGNIVESYYYDIHPENDGSPDFKEAGVELKTTPIKKNVDGTYTAKERLVLGMIDYIAEAGRDFSSSTYFKKNGKLMLLSYLHEDNKTIGDVRFLLAKLYEFEKLPLEDKKIIREDWEKINTKIKAGLAHELSEGDTLYLGACTKSATSANRRPQRNGPEAKPRAFSYKPSYMNQLLKRELGTTEDVERLLSEKELTEDKTFEQQVIERFSSYIGKSVAKISEMVDVDLPSNQKSKFAKLARAMLGIKKAKIEEFEAAGVTMKTIQLKADGTPKEAMSFPTFKYTEIVNQLWDGDEEEGQIRAEFQKQIESRFLFIVYRCEDKCSTSDSRVLEKAFFWTMPSEDIIEAQRVWTETVQRTKNGQADNLPKSSESTVAHVRPHARNAEDTYETPHGTFVTKKCFWLNIKYLKKIIESSSTVKSISREKIEQVVSPYNANIIAIPLYNSVGCGEAVFADTDSVELVNVPSWLIKPGAKYFALRTRGDSMNGLGIEEGDIILCQKNLQAPSGSNAVVLIGDDATFKQIRYEKDGLVLIPNSNNPEHKIRKLTQDDEEFKVLGVFVCKL
ncbi:MAG: DNA mismatch repair protein [Candidatus Pacebacteria bacterium]|jgi:SOS-response transcriptional repressor LexA|nr:DNA mismatch repair protein [Candidatus Paceibacterota bacterium]